uniref:Uncharacterized protein n=1 Tax=Arundo donax TaxID=35708 RepID=A0A0A9HYK9_ARUDO
MLTPMVPTRELYFLRHCKKLATDKWAIVDGQVLEESLRAHHRRADQRPLQGDLGRAHHMPQCHGPVDVLDGNCERTGVRREALDGGASAAVREDGLLGGDQHSEKGLEWCLHTGRQKERPEGRAPDDVEPVSRHRQIAGPGMEQGIADAGNNVHITSGKNTGDPGELEGMIACAVNPTALSDFLRDETRRCKWDVTLPGSGRSVQSFVNLAKGKHRGNCVTAYAATEQNGEWILQDSSTNAYESTVAYAPIDAAIL